MSKLRTLEELAELTPKQFTALMLSDSVEARIHARRILSRRGGYISSVCAQCWWNGGHSQDEKHLCPLVSWDGESCDRYPIHPKCLEKGHSYVSIETDLVIRECSVCGKQHMKSPNVQSSGPVEKHTPSTWHTTWQWISLGPERHYYRRNDISARLTHDPYYGQPK